MADVSIVVLVPGMGDDVQALKAGVMEIADIFVVNKADREGADRTVAEIESLLGLRPTPRVSGARPSCGRRRRPGGALTSWSTPSIAFRGQSRPCGVEASCAAVRPGFASDSCRSPDAGRSNRALSGVEMDQSGRPHRGADARSLHGGELRAGVDVRGVQP